MTETGKERVGDYELLALIGDGAQGRVYQGRYTGPTSAQLVQDEIVAIKLIRITGDDDKLRSKFQSQADILRRLSHTNIVRYRDSFSWHSGEWDEAQCLVMEFLEGETLADRLKKANTGLPWAQVEEVFEQCLAGLIHARERGITHRDLKPSNIFITKDGAVKVIDFDIARQDEGGQMSTAGWKGTFDYMAPDFITIPGFRGDEASDIFSLGVCFYQALTGTLPYDGLGESAHIGYLNRWKDGGAPAPSFRPAVFRVLSNAKPFVSRCLAAKREQRYATFAAMLEDFRKIRSRRIRHKNKDEYELLAVLGRGGFGEVFKARRISDGALVAVKHLFAEKQSERFIKEAKILQQYSHPNLVKYIDFMIVEGAVGEKQYFLILEFLEGMPGWTLRTRLKNEGRLEPSEAFPLYIGYLSALQFLHENSRPIIHRDIKPGNLYAPVGQPGKGKIFDLGVARDVSGTVTVGGVPGTLDYMPPEFAEAGGDRGSPQSDLYALGLCLYESLAGRPVYDRLPTDVNSAWMAFQQRLRKPVELSFEGEAFRQYPRLKGVILKALAQRPVDRYRSAAELKLALEHIQGGTGYDDSPADDGQAELTIATLHSFADENDFPLPEPGATVGTRPLEELERTMAAPLNLVAAGKAEAVRRRRRKVLMLAGLVVVGLLLAGGLGRWMVGSPEVRKTEALDRGPERAVKDVDQMSGGLTSPVPSAASVKALQVAALEREWAGACKRIMDQITNARDRDSLQLALVEFGNLEKNPDVNLQPAQIKSVEEAAVARYLLFAGELVRQAKAAYEGDRMVEGQAAMKSLTALIASVPERFRKGSLSGLEQEVEASRLAAETRQRQALAIRKSIQDATQVLGELRGRVGRGNLEVCVDGARILADVSAVALSDPGLKVQWESGVAEYSALIERTLMQKDPLSQRLRRIKAVDTVLNEAAAEQVLAGRARTLRENSAKQKTIFILRFCNKSGEDVRISGQELKSKLMLVRDGALDQEWPVHSAGTVVSLMIEGREDRQPRIESVSMRGAGGAELVIAPLDKVLPVAKPVVVEAVPVDRVPPVVKPIVVGTALTEKVPPVAKPVAVETALVEKVLPGMKPGTGETAPVASGGTGAPSVAVVSGNGVLNIVVAPRLAAIKVDGNSVKAGRVEVSPGENHQVMVEAPGFKSCVQYYRVRAGEVRKIEILLEKDIKRSMFGW